MNLLDMHTREKVNQIRLDEMHREANARRLRRHAKQGGHMAKILRHKKVRLALTLVALLIVFGSLLMEVRF